MRLLGLLRSAAFALLAHSLLSGAVSAQTGGIASTKGGTVRALVIGIDGYEHAPRLRGAVADARDLEATLRHNGVIDLTVLTDAASDRAAVTRSLDELASRAQTGDLIVLTIAGLGAQEPERIKGSQPGGLESVFLLPGFNAATASGTQQRIFQSEFNHFIRKFEAKGAGVLFVVDTCQGGNVTREPDARAGEMSYRQAPQYTLAVDTLTPISSVSDAFIAAGDFQRTAVLTAVDRDSKAPEVRVPGEPGFRGALSYAVARALEGAADANQDGLISQGELFSYVRQVTYQLSDQRQNIVATGSLTRNAEADALFARTRAVVLLNAPSGQQQRPQPSAAASPTPTAAPPVARPAATPSSNPALPLLNVRIAVLGNERELLKDIEPREARFEVVNTNENPDLVWDPTTRDVLAGADVIARGIDRSDLSSVVDRIAAVSGFKRLAAKAPQAVRVLPDDKVHRNQSRIEIQVSGVSQRALLMFNIAGDGTVQSLYPIGSDAPIVTSADYKFPVLVGAPFGADQVVAITSSQRLGDLEQALKKMNQRRTAAEVYKLIERYAPADARIGATNLYTSP
jgi:uncharacterized caspase-like protein